CQHEGDELKYRGEPKSFVGIDEASGFHEVQIDRLIAWLRSGDERCRLVLATNPPTTADIDSEWIKRWFAPWIDENHHLYPYPEGKPLWFERLADGSFRFETEPFEIEIGDGQKARALTRSFIGADLADNPDLDRDGQYRDQLASMPEELRRRLQRGE